MLRRLIASLACLVTVGVLLVVPPAHATTSDATTPDATTPGTSTSETSGTAGAEDLGSERQTGDGASGSGWITDSGGAARGGEWRTTPADHTVDERGRLTFSAQFYLGTVVGGPVYLERWPLTATAPDPPCTPTNSVLEEAWRDGRLPQHDRHTGAGSTDGRRTFTWTLEGAELSALGAGRHRLHAWTGVGVAMERNYACFTISVRLQNPHLVSSPQSVTVDERQSATFSSSAADPTGATTIVPAVPPAAMVP